VSDSPPWLEIVDEFFEEEKSENSVDFKYSMAGAVEGQVRRGESGIVFVGLTSSTIDKLPLAV
jgi:hypothetical protein